MAATNHFANQDDALAAAMPEARRVGDSVYLCEWPAIRSWSVEPRKPSIRGGRVIEVTAGGGQRLA